MRPAVKQSGFNYWEYMLCYVDDLLCIHEDPTIALTQIQAKFKLKDDKMEEPSTYLGADLSMMTNMDNKSCWAMSSNSYCKVLVDNTEKALLRHNTRLPSKVATPLKCGYKPEIDSTDELKGESITWYQELVGCLRWAVEIGRVDILLETALM